MAGRDCHGRRICDGLVQHAFLAMAGIILFPLLLLSLIVWRPARRWGDPRYRW